MNKATQIRYRVFAFLFIFVTLALLGFSLFVHYRATTVGSRIGDTNGRMVGTAIGSYNGIIHGIQEGADDGIQAGLSAIDTSANVKGTLDAIGRLEVLKARVTLKSINSIGTAYKGLNVISGDAVFSVDLCGAEISFSQNGNDVYIWLSEPSLELFLDQSSTKKLAEIQNVSLTVDAKDGLNAYLNSMTQTVENVNKTLTNYDALMMTAKESAKKQVGFMVSTVCGDNKHVQVNFR